MHTLKILLAGLLILGACLLLGYLSAGPAALRLSALVFIPLWLLGALCNMWVGVRRAGYSVKDELPVLVVVFVVPASVALLIWWKLAA